MSKSENIDCLVCHDTTGTYRKFPTACGNPPLEDKKCCGKLFQAVDLKKVAQHVGPASRVNCGRCHFYGGGADGVKHGDLDSSLFKPDKKLDVHMDAKGLNYACTKCHVTRAHQVSGRCYVTPAPNQHRLALPKDDGNRLACESCHSRHPHKQKIINDHSARVACQTCHIPRFARGGVYTKMWWDWSTAGKFTPDGKMIARKDRNGTLIYHTKKGSMRWARNVVPEYRWYNGTMHYYETGEKIPEGVSMVQLDTPNGSADDPASRIFPFKIMRGKQPYDPVNRIIAVPHLFGKKGSGAYWADYDWHKAVASGMEAAGLPFSGKVDFIKTETYWPITHMVAPKAEALSCEACHQRQNGRLAALRGFYLPGRDRSPGLDLLAWILIVVTGFVILNHAGMRWLIHQKRKQRRD